MGFSVAGGRRQRLHADVLTGAPLADSCDNERTDAGDAYAVLGRTTGRRITLKGAGGLIGAEGRRTGVLNRGGRFQRHGRARADGRTTAAPTAEDVRYCVEHRMVREDSCAGRRPSAGRGMRGSDRRNTVSAATKLRNDAGPDRFAARLTRGQVST
jgi:hypothetical protein